MKSLFLYLALALSAHAAAEIEFHTARPGFVSLNVYRPNGKLARQLLAGMYFNAGDHAVAWNGLAGGSPAPPGEYRWRALFREGLPAEVLGRIGDFGGDCGPPSAATADDTHIYLGWSLATANADAVVACDPTGAVLWTHHRGPLSGCHALAVDAGAVFVLGGEGPDAEGRAIYKLSAKDGTPIPWPDGRNDLKITSLWPAKGKYKPGLADYLTAKNGRIYLSFSAGQFIAVLDAKTGAYLQTIVGAPPGAIDSVATKSDTRDKPGELIDADFVVLALKGGSIGKMLLAHDPIWVLASELTPLDSVDRITALTMIGDGARHHSHDIFAALGPPLNQVQARPALDTDSTTYTAGITGGRAAQGPWQPGAMRDINAVALDGAGQLWAAEGDPIPGRISVWATDGSKGRLVHEYFSPSNANSSPVAVNPLNPWLVFANGCEWLIDPATGRATCLGVITRHPLRAARYAIQGTHLLLVLTPMAGPDIALTRIADGNYRVHSVPAPDARPPRFRIMPMPGGLCSITTADGFDLGTILDPTASTSPSSANVAALSQLPDGKVILAINHTRTWILELPSLETLSPFASGSVTIPQPAH